MNNLRHPLLTPQPLRSAKVTFDDGHTITTSLNGDLSDSDILLRYKVGREFNIGDGHGGDWMAKVVSVQILS